MTKKGSILIMLALSWPITCLHMLWRGNESIVYWFVNSEWDYIQCYFYSLFNLISYLLIFMSIWLYINSSMRKDKDVLLLFGANFINQAIDLPHFIICRRSSEIIILIQGLIICYAAIKILFNQISKK